MQIQETNSEALRCEKTSNTNEGEKNIEQEEHLQK